MCAPERATLDSPFIYFCAHFTVSGYQHRDVARVASLIDYTVIFNKWQQRRPRTKIFVWSSKDPLIVLEGRAGSLH